jgi:hypothetical protein
VRVGGRIWRAKSYIEPRGLDIGGTCVIPPVGGSGGLFEAGEPEVEALGGPGCDEREGGLVWCAKPKIERDALDIGGTCGLPPADGSRALCDAGEGPLQGLGGMEPDVHRGGGC